jgi:hypothetical protein
LGQEQDDFRGQSCRPSSRRPTTRGSANKKHSTILSYGQIWAQHLEKQPSDLRGFTQCHFFSGIGGWSRALRLAGWPVLDCSDNPVFDIPGEPPCGGGGGDYGSLIDDILSVDNPLPDFAGSVTEILNVTDSLPDPVEPIGADVAPKDSALRGRLSQWARPVLPATETHREP